MTSDDARRKILITGATGNVGTLLDDRLRDTYDVVIQGRHPDDERQDRELRRADIEDLDEVRSLMDGVDTVVHLAGAASPDSSWDDVLAANIVGTRNVLEAAVGAGVRRVVYASSNHVMGMYDRLGEWPVYTSQPVRPDSLYGVSKAFGEVIGGFYHDEYGIDFIALRIGWVSGDPMLAEDEVLHAMWLSEDDTEQVVRCAIEAEVKHGVYYAVSDNQNRRWDLTNTMLELGYRPKDSWTDHSDEPEEVIEGGADVRDDWPKDS